MLKLFLIVFGFVNKTALYFMFIQTIELPMIRELPVDIEIELL